MSTTCIIKFPLYLCVFFFLVGLPFCFINSDNCLIWMTSPHSYSGLMRVYCSLKEGSYVTDKNWVYSYIVLKHPVALCIPILGFSLHCLFAAPSICWIHTLRLFVSSYSLFNSTYYQLYKVVDENYCSFVMLLFRYMQQKWKKPAHQKTYTRPMTHVQA
jgi:hypothetical protein